MVSALNQSLRDLSACCIRMGLNQLEQSSAKAPSILAAPPPMAMARGQEDLRAHSQKTSTPNLRSADAKQPSSLFSRIVANAPQLRRLWTTSPVPEPAPKLVPLASVGDTMRYETGADPVVWNFSPEACDKRWDPEAAFWMMWCSQRAFTAEQAETQAELKSLGFDKVRCITVPNTGLQALVARAPSGGVVLAFRGTVDFYGWCTDLNIRLSPLEHNGQEKVHRGFRDALDSGWDQIEAAIKELSNDYQLPIWVTGHSLGGALATLAAVRLKSEGAPVAPLYTFGAPPIGDQAFCERVERHFPNAYFRVAIDEDIVPRALVDNATWNDINPKMPILLKPVEAAMQQLIRSAKFSQGGRLVAIKAPSQQPAGVRLSPSSVEASRHDVRQYWHGLQEQGTDVWTALGRQGRCHDNQAYLASMSKAIKPSLRQQQINFQHLAANQEVQKPKNKGI